MENLTTKEKILDVALILFSQKGYDAVSVEEIAKGVGVKAPSLYKHYKSKETIFDALIEKISEYYSEHTQAMDVHFSSVNEDFNMFSEVTEEALIKKVQDIFCFSLHDEYVSRTRKLLSIEQFKRPKLAQLYTKQYFESSLNYHHRLFEYLVKIGVLINANPRIMALQYVCPIQVLMTMCDREPEKEELALQMLADHIRQFNDMYRTDRKGAIG